MAKITKVFDDIDNARGKLTEAEHTGIILQFAEWKVKLDLGGENFEILKDLLMPWFKAVHSTALEEDREPASAPADEQSLRPVVRERTSLRSHRGDGRPPKRPGIAVFANGIGRPFSGRASREIEDLYDRAIVDGTFTPP